ncbi:hypothetical protein LJR118_003919 [Acidovorax sp. LjRoot118]|uniref:hypothetical protein n=1 Tax=Acidovorax sp. LjRoot118 TaxID=3342256 RepID=UPI003ECD3235
MIAANYRKFPEALALQMPLRFGRALVWALSRPTTRILRAIRAERGAAFKAAGRIAYPVKPATPAWVLESTSRARKLAKAVKQACMAIEFVVWTKPTNPYAKHVARMRAARAATAQ